MRIIGYSNGNRLFIVITSKSSFVNDNYNIFAPRIKHRFSRYCFSDCFYARDDDDDDEQQVSYTVNHKLRVGFTIHHVLKTVRH